MATLASLTPGQRHALELAVDGTITQQHIADAARGVYGEIAAGEPDYAACFLTAAQKLRLRALAALPSLGVDHRAELGDIKQAFVARCSGQEPERAVPETAESWRARNDWIGRQITARDSFDGLWWDARQEALREAARVSRLRQAAE